MNRVTFTLDEAGMLVRVCADEPTEVYFIAIAEPVDQAHLWNSICIGKEAVDAEISIGPISDQYEFPIYN